MTCQICGSASRVVLLKERNVSCGDYFEGRRLYKENLGEFALLECTVCGFGYFPDMQAWPKEKYRKEIYNQDYYLCDPPFLHDRPRKLAAWLSSNLQRCDLIDFGGGEGKLAGLLVEKGFRAHSYDPFYGDLTLPTDGADVVTAFEVIEHVPDQRTLFRLLKALCHPGGIIIFSTLLKPDHLTKDWWYASPRNGHVSFHTANSLKRMVAELGLASLSLSKEIHICAPQADKLVLATAWEAIQINDIPGFAFSNEWWQLHADIEL